MLQLNFTPFPILETERLILRPIAISDSPEVFIMRNDEDLTKYTGGPRAHVMQDAIDFIGRISKNAQNNEAIQWGIAVKGEQNLAGSICYWNIVNEEDKAELGYGLLPAYQKQGIMNEALPAVIGYGHEVMKLKTIEAYTDERNEPYRQLLERNKFQLHEDMGGIKKGQQDLESMLIYVLYG